MTERIVDLSLPFSDGMTGYTRQQVRRFEAEDYNTSNLTFYSHAGTHMDAPLQFSGRWREYRRLEAGAVRRKSAGL